MAQFTPLNLEKSQLSSLGPTLNMKIRSVKESLDPKFHGLGSKCKPALGCLPFLWSPFNSTNNFGCGIRLGIVSFGQFCDFACRFLVYN